MSAVLLLAEYDANGLKTASRQTVSAAQSWNLPVDVLVLGQANAAVLEQAQALAGVRKVLHANAEHLNHARAEDAAKLLQSLAADYSVVIAPHNSQAKNILPRFAALMDVGMVSEALEIHAQDQANPGYVRPIYAGNLLATVANKPGLQVLSVRASRWKALDTKGNADLVQIAAPAADSRVRWLSVDHAGGERPELSSARVVVSGGRSLGSAEKFEAVLGPLATQLGAALGATRAAVDAGHAPNEFQVGQTGTIVAPELYIAMGVSGAIQHLAGIKDSRVIVAVNIDPDALIFQVADYGLVADLFEVAPELTAALQKQ
jgi:electron transfer flavoprotein alpha subunit